MGYCLYIKVLLVILQIEYDQLGSLVVRAFTPCLGGPGSSQIKDFKLV